MSKHLQSYHGSVSATERACEVVTASAEPALLGLRVLVADGDESSREQTREHLQGAGFEVSCAADGHQALTQFERDQPDAVLLDVALRGLDGFQVCAALRASPIGVHTAIVMFTSRVDAELVTCVHEVGATDFLPKPISYPILLRRLRYALRAAELERSPRDGNRHDAGEQARYLAYFDPVTGFPNRNFLHEYAHHALERAARDRTTVALLLVDLDHFKLVNNTLGHVCGDRALREVAERLRDCVRRHDAIRARRLPGTRPSAAAQRTNPVASLGGDEFVIVLEDLPEVGDAALLAECINETLSCGFRLDDAEVCVTASVGISLYPVDGPDFETLLKQSEVAMYGAKHAGRMGYQFFSRREEVRLMHRLRLKTELRTALQNEQFVLHYQPRMNVSTGKVEMLEALIRWNHPQRGLLSPDEFIPLAEENGSIVEIGEWVLKTACLHLKKWESMVSMGVSVNISPSQLSSRDFPRLVRETLQGQGLSAGRLELELTESMLFENLELSAQVLKELKEIGVRISLDDFGTGYSSLAYIKHFPVDVLKIDRSLIEALNGDWDYNAIVRTILHLAADLGVWAVAEGVEDAGQLEFLRLHSCEQAQGYLISEPLDVLAMTHWLADWHVDILTN